MVGESCIRTSLSGWRGRCRMMMGREETDTGKDYQVADRDELNTKL
jgi:hypothetical protein